MSPLCRVLPASYTLGHGAWQTPFVEQELPGVGPALTLMLQLPWDGPMRYEKAGPSAQAIAEEVYRCLRA